jgi:pantoate--beta-alanine ligase
MKEWARGACAEGHVLGLVPTMGALHPGHSELVKRAKAECSKVVVSIFVNPKQFGPNEDYKRYPRDLEKDAEILKGIGVDAVFAPEVEEIYPDGFRTYVTVEGISERLEGKTRPGHFRGVATVVLKLLEIVAPRFAYFGRKDAQQLRIIHSMARDLNLDTEIVAHPIVREADGLALSSRNAYLSGEERKSATALYRALVAAKAELEAGERDALELQRVMAGVIGDEKAARLDYAELVNAEAFEPVVRVGSGSFYALVAAWVGKTRLIDNALIEVKGDEMVVQL